MIGLPNGARVWLACGITDLRNGFDGLAGLVQMKLAEDPFSGQLFVFRGRRGDRVKVLWWDGDGRWTVPLRKAPRARPIRLATGNEWHSPSDGGSVIDAT